MNLRAPWITALLALLLVPLAPAGADGLQAPTPAPPAADTVTVLTGTVLLAESREPAEAARVELIAQGRTAITDSAGRFRIEALTPGPDTLRVSTLGGRDQAWPLRLEPGRVERVEVHLDPNVIELGGLEVTVEGRPPTELERLARRIDRGVGEYITRSELQEHEGRLSFAFRGMLGARVEFVSRADFRVLLRNYGPGGRGYCPPQMFVDGRRQEGLAVDDFHPDDLAAVEVYTADVLPGEYRTSRASRCGAIAIWTVDFVRQ